MGKDDVGHFYCLLSGAIFMGLGKWGTWIENPDAVFSLGMGLAAYPLFVVFRDLHSTIREICK